ncbi:MAG: type II secretion system protein GspM [Pseudomonadota bacterium]
MKQYLMNLQPRERYIVMAGGGILFMLLIYLLLIEPFIKEMDRLEKSVAAQQEELAWMQAAAEQVEKLRAENPERSGLQSNQSLLSLLDTSAREQGLSKSLKQLSPVGDKVRVRLEEASFDTMLNWFGMLEQRSDVGVDSLTLERHSAPGVVNATVVLGQGGQG